MGLRDIELTLPPGFRFYPSDEELVCHYLHSKVASDHFGGGGAAAAAGTMVEVDLHVHEPWELPDVAKLSTNEWYFFSFRDRKYATGLRTNRATKSGYWKATGKDRVIRDPRRRAAVVGMRKTLVFYRGRAPNGAKTCWVMHEFRIENPHAPPREDWVLCRVFHKKKADTEYAAMDGDQLETTGAAMAAAAANRGLIDASSSCHDPDYYPPPQAPFPSLGGHHPYHPPPSSCHHHRHGGGGAPASLISDDFQTMPPLLSYDDGILDFTNHLDAALAGAPPAVSRHGGTGGDERRLMELGLEVEEEHYSYNSLMQM